MRHELRIPLLLAVGCLLSTPARAYDPSGLIQMIVPQIVDQMTRPPEPPRYAPPPAYAPPPVRPQPSPALREAQGLLNALGYEAGPADGLPGARTARALRAFQSDFGLDDTGTLTPQTLATLREARKAPPGAPAPVAGSATGGANPSSPDGDTPVGAAAPAAPMPPIGFDLPAPDARRVFDLYVAANGDLLDTAAFAWFHAMLLDWPADKSALCGKIGQSDKNEFARREVEAQIRDRWRAVLPTLASVPATGRFTLRGRRTLGDYDGRGFPFGNYMNWDLGSRAGNIEVSEKTPLLVEGALEWKRMLARRQSGTDRACARPMYRFMLPDAPEVPQAFRFLLAQELPKTLPLPEVEARRLIDELGDKREVRIEAVVEISPFALQNRIATAPAKLLALQAVEPRSGRVVHVFDLGSAPTAGEPAVAASEIAVASPPAIIALSMLRDHPGLLTPEDRLALATEQAKAEQDQLRRVAEAFGPAWRSSDPKRRFVAFEWEKQSAADPALADGALLDLFLRPRGDWSFVAEQGVDLRIRRRIGVFMFDNGRVVDREASFAGRELQPVYERHLAAAIARAPRRVQLTLEFPRYDNLAYDPASGAVRFQRNGQEFLGEGKPLMPPAQIKATPPSQRGRALYEPDTVRVPESREKTGKWETSGPDFDRIDTPLVDWRERLVRRSFEQAKPVLALDRDITLSAIPMSAQQAEAFARATRFNPLAIRTRVTFDIEGTQLDAPGRTAFIQARLAGVDLVDEKGTLLASLPVEQFPLQSEIEAGEKATAASTAAAGEQAYAARMAARSKGPFGPEMIGLRLGMTAEEADRIIRNHMPVAVVLTRDQSSHPTRRFGWRAYARADTREFVALFIHETDDERVVGISRSLDLPTPLTPEQFEAMFVDKYGKPNLKQEKDEMFWGDAEAATAAPTIPGGCFAIRQLSGSSSLDGYEYQEGKGLGSSADDIKTNLYTIEPVNSSSDTVAFASCPTSLGAEFYSYGTSSKIVTVLSDGEWLAALERKAAAGQATTAPDIKL